MVDSVIAGTGNSRYLRTSIGADTTWAEALEMLRAGTFPIDLAGINQAGFSTLGTALNSDTLLKSAVIIALGLDSDATPSDAWEAVLALIDAKADADSAVTAVTYDTETKTLSATINGTSTAIATFDFVNAEEASAAAPVQSVAGKTGTVTLGAGDVAYDETATYNDGTVGSEMSDAAAQIAKNTDDILSVYPTDTAGGSIATFSDGADGVPVKSLTVNIEPAQSGSGDPAPDNVRPISGWETVGVFSAGNGINLFNQETLLQAPDWVLRDETFMGKPVYGGTIRHLYDAFGSRLPVDFKFKENTRYFVGFWWRRNTPSTENGIRIRWNYTDGTYVNAPVGANNTDEMVNVGVTSAAGKTLDHISITYNNSSYIFISGFTICEYQPGLLGPVYDSMMPYHVDLGQTVYGGTLDVVSGVLTIDRQMLTLDGSESWGEYAAGNPYGTCFRRVVTGFVEWANLRETLVCDRFTASSLANPNQNTGLNGTFWFNAEGNGIRFVWGEPNAGTTVAEWKAWLTDNPVTVVGKMATPVTVQLTPAEVTTLLGLNNIWADAGDVDVTYRADVGLYVRKRTGGEADMIADANIPADRYFLVGNTLYFSTAAIAAGETIVPGTNCTLTNLAEALNALNT